MSARRLALIPLVLLLAGCADEGPEPVKRDADAYIAGVQYHDALGLIKHMAGFREEIASTPPAEWEGVRARWMDTVEARFAEYEEAKDSGWLPLQEDGINLLQGLAVGKGIFYTFQDLRLEEDGARAVGVMEVIPDYEEHRFEGLPPGTRVYLLGEPLNRVQTVVLGRSDEEQTLRVPARVLLEWRFRRFEAIDVYPASWAVESIQAVEGGVEMKDLRRVF